MSVTDDIKARLDIVQFISQYVPLKKAGRNYTAPCPFHNERTPSFVVFPDNQSWHCFGACAEGGDIFNFVMKREGLDFVSALRLLAEQANVDIPDRSPDQGQQDAHLDRLRGLLDEAGRFFHTRLLEGADAGHARDYAQRRGFADKIIDQFGIGYAADSYQSLLEHLKRLGYEESLIIETGLAIHNEEKDRTYDRFRNRLMIPICDERGRVIGFGARALAPEDHPKYLNSPQTALFDKGGTLFGLHLARRAIRESETAVIVEGYMDAIQAHQAGFSNVVAQMGTALTRPQLKQIGKYARRVVLALDPDAAGAKATMRGLDVVRQASERDLVFFDPGAMLRQASRLDLDMQVITLPEGQDPDDLIRADPDRWRRLVDTAQPVADYVIAAGTAHLTPHSTLAEREQVARDLLPILMATESRLQEYENLQKLAYKLRLGSGRELAAWAQTLVQKVAPPARPDRNPPTGDARAENVGSRQASQPTGQRPDNQSDPQSESPSDSQTAPDAAQRQPGSGSTAQRGPHLSATGAAAEEECLSLLLRYPDLLATANRRLRVLAQANTAAATSLGPLGMEDFTRNEYRAVFDTLARALAQDDVEVLDYLHGHLPHDLHDLVERLLHEPLAQLEARLGGPLATELRSILRETRYRTQIADSAIQVQPLLDRRALELRKLRLRRENTDLQILQQESMTAALGASDPETLDDAEARQRAAHDTDQTFAQRVRVNQIAIALIDHEMRRTPTRQ